EGIPSKAAEDQTPAETPAPQVAEKDKATPDNAATAKSTSASAVQTASVTAGANEVIALDLAAGSELAYVELFPIVPSKPLTVELYVTCRIVYDDVGGSPLWNAGRTFTLLQAGGGFRFQIRDR